MLAGWAAWPAWAGKAHEHGVARAEVVVEAGRITVTLELALHDLVGFERAPRADAERTSIAGALGRLQEAAKMARIDAAGGCGAAKVQIEAPAWGVSGAASMAPPPAPSTSVSSAASASKPAAGVGPAAKAGGEHADLRVAYEYRCSHSDRAAHLELGLFDAFARLRRIELQAVAPKGQMKLVLRRPNARLALAR